MTKSRIRTIGAALAAAVAVSTVLAGCGAGAGTGDAGGKAGTTITVWSGENQPDRVATTQKVIDGFTKKTGIKVKLVAIDDSQVVQLTQSAALSGKLPDVMGALSLAEIRQFASLKLLNTAAAADVVKNLGADTFQKSALALDQDGSTQLAVPDSAWAQVLVYRKDLFEKAGLKPPTTYAAIEQAAKTLTTGDQSGITLATDPADVFTEQTFESLALGNGCQLVNKKGDVTIGDSACDPAWKLYAELAGKYSPSGTQTVDTTRASYFAGQSAMVDWSTYILDELAGLRNDALPSCPQCQGNPQWLAKNSGIVTSIAGPDGKPATLGSVSSWAVTKKADAAASEKFVEYMMSTGYLDWLGMAPEGKFPVRTGTAAKPTEYSDGWRDLKAGVDTKATLASIYDADTMKAIESVPDHIDTWAIPQGQGALLGAVETQLTLPQVLGDLASGGTSLADAPKSAADAVTQVKAKQPAS